MIISIFGTSAVSDYIDIPINKCHPLKGGEKARALSCQWEIQRLMQLTDQRQLLLSGIKGPAFARRCEIYYPGLLLLRIDDTLISLADQLILPPCALPFYP